FTKARPVVFIPILVIGVGIVVAIRSGLFKGAESGVMSWVSSPASLILLLVAGIALVVLSVLLSLARYKRREL
ncbi:MAG: hypothetical protein ABI400_12880, partial [Lacisediminihabitans sp.]